MKQLYRAGLYCRLSVDDANNSAKTKNYILSDESTSIENQRELLSKFVMLNGWIEVRAYIDDGYSGGNFQRPSFLEMLEDARKGVINLILVKDLSRLGRNFVEVGCYTDYVFPSLGCRFVSVLDCLDSEGDNTDMLHFRSLMNDYHLKDLSTKIKTVLHSKMMSGQYLGAYAPYGYKKSVEDKHKLVIDEEAAAVVRSIYKMRLSGMSYNKITGALNRNDIPAPRYYWNQAMGKDNSKTSRLWTERAVKLILLNEVYLGTLVMNCAGTRSYKDKTRIDKPESEWIRHEVTHEAIIDLKAWDAVQKINQKAKQISNGHNPPKSKLFSGKLICGDCKGPMIVSTSVKRAGSAGKRRYLTDKWYVTYHCAKHTSSGRSVCSYHSISEISLKQMVVAEIQAQAKAAKLDQNKMTESLEKRMNAHSHEALAGTHQEITVLQRRLKELTDLTARLYEDKISGAISAETFQMLVQKQEQERTEKEARLATLLAEVNQAEQNTSAIQSWVQLISKYTELQDLDRETIDELIDYIEIGKAETTNGKRIRNITIHYRFVDLLN